MAGYDLDLPALAGCSRISLKEAQLLDSTTQHPLLWHLDQLSQLGAQVLECDFVPWTPSQMDANIALIDRNVPTMSHIPGLRERRFTFEEEIIKFPNFRLYNLNGNSRKASCRDLNALTRKFVGVQGNIEASPDLLETCPAAGASILSLLKTEFPATIITPVPVGITSEGMVAPFHFHHLPSLNCLVASFIAGVGRSCYTWDGEGSDAITKFFILIDGRDLEVRGIKISSWMRSLPWSEFLQLLKSKLSRATILGLKFYYGTQSMKANTILFPERWLHYVVTVNHAGAGNQHTRYWTGISAYYVPHTNAACQRLSQHIDEHHQDVHLRHQNPEWYSIAQNTLRVAQTAAITHAPSDVHASPTALSPTKVDADGKP
jgi:hypothetical protein